MQKKLRVPCLMPCRLHEWALGPALSSAEKVGERQEVVQLVQHILHTI